MCQQGVGGYGILHGEGSDPPLPTEKLETFAYLNRFEIIFLMFMFEKVWFFKSVKYGLLNYVSKAEAYNKTHQTNKILK